MYLCEKLDREILFLLEQEETLANMGISMFFTNISFLLYRLYTLQDWVKKNVIN